MTPTDNKVTLFQVSVAGRMGGAGTSGFSAPDAPYPIRKQAGTVSAIFGASAVPPSISSDNLLYTAFYALSGADLLFNVGGVAGQTMTWALNVRKMETG